MLNVAANLRRPGVVWGQKTEACSWTWPEKLASGDRVRHLWRDQPNTSRTRLICGGLMWQEQPVLLSKNGEAAKLRDEI